MIHFQPFKSPLAISILVLSTIAIPIFGYLKYYHYTQDIPQYSILGALPGNNRWVKDSRGFGPYTFNAIYEGQGRVSVSIFPPTKTDDLGIFPIEKSATIFGQTLTWHKLPRGNFPSAPQVGTSFKFQRLPQSKPVSITIFIRADDQTQLDLFLSSFESLRIE